VQADLSKHCIDLREFTQAQTKDPTATRPGLSGEFLRHRLSSGINTFEYTQKSGRPQPDRFSIRGTLPGLSGAWNRE
jgi:hypothetical protein